MANKHLVGVFMSLALYAFWTIIDNPHQEYSTEEYWKDATLVDVENVPQAALEPGNNSGPVLMWAASVTNNPEIIAALVQRGANVNGTDSYTKTRSSRTGNQQTDSRIKATALSAAAYQSTSPEVIAELVKLGAKLDTRHSYGRTALMIAASANTDARIARELIRLGADTTLESDLGKTALDIAKEMKNYAVVEVLENHYAEMDLD